MKRILVAGELNVDLVFRDCQSFPTPGHEVLAEDALVVPGSSSMICAMGLARLGNPVAFAGKVGVDGKDVGPMVHAGQLDLVRNYCLCDVLQTAAVFLRVQLLRGELTPDSYKQAIDGLITFAKSEPRVAPVVASWNEPRLRLEPV